MITDEDIKTLQLIAKEDYGVILTREQAQDEGERWLAAVQDMRPIPKNILKPNTKAHEK